MVFWVFLDRETDTCSEEGRNQLGGWVAVLGDVGVRRCVLENASFKNDAPPILPSYVYRRFDNATCTESNSCSKRK